MSAQAKIFSLTKDDHDRDEWSGPVHVLEGHWSPWAALTHYFHMEDPDPGTYRCASSGGTGVLGWDGERVVKDAA